MVIKIPKLSVAGGLSPSQIEKKAAAVFKLKRRSLFSYIPLRRAAELLQTSESGLIKYVQGKTKRLHAIVLSSGNMVFHPDSFNEMLKDVLHQKLLIELGADEILEGS